MKSYQENRDLHRVDRRQRQKSIRDRNTKRKIQQQNQVNNRVNPNVQQK